MLYKNQIQTLVINELVANLPTGINQNRIKYKNAPFKTPVVPDNILNNAAINYAWLDVTLSDISATPESKLRRLRQGILSIDLNWPKLVGNIEAEQTAELILSIFENKWLNETLKINLGLITEIDNFDWYVLNIVFDYFYEGSVNA